METLPKEVRFEHEGKNYTATLADQQAPTSSTALCTLCNESLHGRPFYTGPDFHVHAQCVQQFKSNMHQLLLSSGDASSLPRLSSGGKSRCVNQDHRNHHPSQYDHNHPPNPCGWYGMGHHHSFYLSPFPPQFPPFPPHHYPYYNGYPYPPNYAPFPSPIQPYQYHNNYPQNYAPRPGQATFPPRPHHHQAHGGGSVSQHISGMSSFTPILATGVLGAFLQSFFKETFGNFDLC